MARPIDGRPVTHVDVDGSLLDVEASFCYLGGMLGAGGGCGSAIAARCCVAWGEFRKLLPVLTTRHLSPKIRGKVYSACVRSAMLHGGGTFGPNGSSLRRLRRGDRAVVRWMCGAGGRVETSSGRLLLRLGIDDITSVLLGRRLGWFGHVQRSTSSIRSVTDLAIPGNIGRGRPRKTWSECVKNDIRECNLSGVNPLDRDAWRQGVRLSLVLPTP